MKRSRIHRRIRRCDRRGLTIIMVIAFYAIAVAMIGVWVRSALDRQQQVRRWHEKTQAVWLAESGVRRAVAQLTIANGYEGELWEISATELAGNHAAEVLITIEREPAKSGVENESTAAYSQVTISATADYPAGDSKRVQHTKTTEHRISAIPTDSGESS